MIKDRDWYREEVCKLLAIMWQDDDFKGMVAKTYIIEKLQAILNEQGIGIHPTLETPVKNIKKNYRTTTERAVDDL